MGVIDVIHPHTPGARAINDHIEVTCTPSGQVPVPDVTAPQLHPTMSIPLALMKEGRLSEAVFEALHSVEERVQSLAARKESGQELMESVFGARPPQLDITTTTGQTAQDEQEGFRHLFIGAMLCLRDPHSAGAAVPIAADETLEYVVVASMLMRRLDRAESRLA